MKNSRVWLKVFCYHFAAIIPQRGTNQRPISDPNTPESRFKLQHEQIHFALTELAARKLTSDAQKWASNLLVIRQTPQEVYSEIVQQIKNMINAAMEANQKRHEEFEKDTSLFYSPSWQAWWLETVEEQLKQTESSINKR